MQEVLTVVELLDRIQRNTRNFENKAPELEQVGMHVRLRGAFNAVIWKGKRDGCMMINIHKLTTEDNFHMNPGQLVNQLLLKTTFSTWPVSAKRALWLKYIQLVRERGSEHIHYFLPVGSNNME
jgi:hypothetical protein